MIDFVQILKKEVVPAQGCTEPIAVAYATSIAAEQLEKEEVKSIELYLSANIIKNGLGVGIPGTGKVGIDIAAALGAIICRSDKKLEVLQGFSQEQLDKANVLVKNVRISQKVTDEKLYVECYLESDNHNSRVKISGNHTNVVRIEKDGKILLDKKVDVIAGDKEESTGLTIENIVDFASTVDFKEIEFILDAVKMNRKVSKEGLKNSYGLQVGNKIYGAQSNMLVNNATLRILSATCAASDARMDGCPLPIMTTAGSGNQGIACTLPVIEFAKMADSDEEELARALVISNLVVIHIKEYMGRLSPLCGAGIAGGTGACCGMVYLQGGKLPQIICAIKNMVATLSGLICDGAKTTCALKIAAGTNAAILCSSLAMSDIAPTNKDGIIFDDVEDTVRNIGKLVKEGLSQTDETILKIMLEKQIGGNEHEKSSC